MKLILCAWAWMAITAVGAHAAGGELGNAFMPFESKIGGFSLEYSDSWAYNDLSEATSFSERTPATGKPRSFFLVVAPGTGGPNSLGDLLSELEVKFPGVAWAQANLGGASGWQGEGAGGEQLVYLLRAPGNLVSVHYRSAGDARNNEILAHMLATFRL